jgi:hypothetical protein
MEEKQDPPPHKTRTEQAFEDAGRILGNRGSFDNASLIKVAEMFLREPDSRPKTGPDHIPPSIVGEIRTAVSLAKDAPLAKDLSLMPEVLEWLDRRYDARGFPR